MAAKKTTLNETNLEALGAKRLAELLIELTKGDATAKRRLRFELVSAFSPTDLAREVRKRLDTIDRSRSFVDWRERDALIVDLETQRCAIVERIAPEDPGTAFDLIWRFLELPGSIFERCDDGSGRVIDVFHRACVDLGEIAATAKPDEGALAQRVFTALCANDYGQFDYLISTLSPTLGANGLARLKDIISSDGSADHRPSRLRAISARVALQDIADAVGDIDGFIAQHTEQAKRLPHVAADIAHRLLEAGRADEALETLEFADTSRDRHPFEWECVRIATLEALGREDEAHAFRWTCFETSLNGDHLRGFLRALPDFEDVEAEERAFQHAGRHPDFHRALAFFLNWPTLTHANQLVLARATELNGDLYELLSPAADMLAGEHPLASTIVRRSLIAFTLEKGRSKRYRHAARHLMECASMAAMIDDFASIATHDAYVARLQKLHARKRSFWDQVAL